MRRDSLYDNNGKWKFRLTQEELKRFSRMGPITPEEMIDFKRQLDEFEFLLYKPARVLNHVNGSKSSSIVEKQRGVYEKYIRVVAKELIRQGWDESRLIHFLVRALQETLRLSSRRLNCS